jgi:molybdate transport system substrate-binding protein
VNITNFFKTAATLAITLSALAAHAATITVFAAASLTDSLQEIGQTYERKSGDKIEFNFAGSSVLERQIEAGAPADIFFSADEAKMDALAKKGLVDEATRRTRLSNTLVIVVPSDSPLSIHSASDLISDRITHIALAAPPVPAGVYAKQYLVKLNLWKQAAPKVVPMANVRAALGAVESGDADAGIVYSTDAAISKKVRVAYAVPAQAGPKISYPVAILKGAPESPAARAFLDYLESDAAGQVFARFGFIVDNPAP